MQSINENIADIITQLQIQKERGGGRGGEGVLCNMDSTKVVR